MFVFLHEMLLKVPTPLIWSLKPYGSAVPSSLIQNSSLVLRSEVSKDDHQTSCCRSNPNNMHEISGLTLIEICSVFTVNVIYHYQVSNDSNL